MSDKKAQPDSAIEGWQAYSGKSTVTWPHPTAVNAPCHTLRGSEGA